MVVASLLSLLDFMLIKHFFFALTFTHRPPWTYFIFWFSIYLFILAVMHFARPSLLRNEHFNAGLKVMCSQPAYLVIYFKEGSVVGRKSATNNLSAQTHTDTHCWSTWSLCLSFKYIPTLHTNPSTLSPPSSPPSMLCLHLHFLVSLPSCPFEV